MEQLVIVAMVLLGAITSPSTSSSTTTTPFSNGNHTIEGRLKLDVVRRDQILTSPVKDIRSEVLTLHRAAYLVPVGFGSPPNTVYMTLDLRSTAIWFQCQASSLPSFAEILTCEGCERLENTHCHKRECIYEMHLADKSYTKGKVGLDTITIGGMAIRNVAIACGFENNRYFAKVPGIMGLGGEGPRGMSFLAQLEPLAGGVFTYCLPSVGPGWLEFGSGIYRDAPAWVPLVFNPRDPTLYYVELTGLGVGNRRVTLPEGLFKMTPEGDGGTVLDTIAFVTTLPKVAYEAFREAYIAEAGNLPRIPIDETVFDTCFDLRGMGTVQMPTVTMYFGATSLTLSSKNFLYLVDGVGVFCFAFGPSSTRLVTIGTFQQVGIQISIDTAGGNLGFGPNFC